MGNDPANNVDPSGGNIFSAIWSFLGGSSGAISQTACYSFSASAVNATSSSVTTAIRIATVSLAVGGSAVNHVMVNAINSNLSAVGAGNFGGESAGNILLGSGPNGTGYADPIGEINRMQNDGLTTQAGSNTSNNRPNNGENLAQKKGIPCYDQLYEQYPKSVGETECTKNKTNVYENNCAVRMFYTLEKLGYDLSYPDSKLDKECNYIVAAVNFARWFRKNFGDPVSDSATSNSEPGLKVLTSEEFKKSYQKKKGIIYFEFKYGRYGTGHVDVWTGGDYIDGLSYIKSTEPTRASADYRNVQNVKIWFWETPACPEKTAIPCAPIKNKN
jgi:hypothetical protein